jgi:protein-L-isoaspartate O-methyltransferase
LIEQLKEGGRLISRIIEKGFQHLVVIKITGKGLERWGIAAVLYINLRRVYGVVRE